LLLPPLSDLLGVLENTRNTYEMDAEPISRREKELAELGTVMASM
jgi:hypothetical protein